MVAAPGVSSIGVASLSVRAFTVPAIGWPTDGRRLTDDGVWPMPLA